MATSSFAVMNKAVNPVMAAVLRSPLHAVLSGRHILLTYTGRRSGRRFTLVTFYSGGPDELEVAVGWPQKKVWWRNLTGEGGAVDVVLRGVDRTGHAVATYADGDQVARVTITLDPA